ncbi:putative fungal specific transcription factor [Lyophyllum shimeji]|uniref:Fungal specific transcription factor n=1 Tax=Lyophyllum shimeji TaxID=47721 RepID=A0A9P3PG29_LYOSH|nr:putative fungal specific transcription factor [Lyophyllum shimeji]
MPPDIARAASHRRTQRKLTEEELKEIELKRIRGELSCAECRRLKLRCDKKVPCTSCSRRGCESICPCGILSAGQGTRFILADTEQLHRKIADMSHRIRQLEDALAILQSTVSDERHPLLHDDLLKIKFGPEARDARHTSSTSGTEQAMAQSIDALGTLTLGDSGEMKYFGRSAGSETLMMAGEDSADEGDDEVPAVALGPEIETLANLFPFTKRKRSSAKTIALLESHLPPQERALSLCDSYLKHAANFFRPIKRDELYDSFMPGIYKAASASRESPGVVTDESDSARGGPEASKNTPHALATLYFLFALGALLDLTLAPYNAEAEHYYELARAALSLRVVFDAPQLDTVQAVGLMATYHCLAGKKYSRDSAWCVMSFAAKLAQAIGLHRDPARWNMDAKTVQKRRMLFWEVFSADLSHSLALGRPPAMNLAYIDCDFPTDEEATLSDEGELHGGFWQMKYAFARDMFLAVADTTLVAKSPSYTTILNLDRKVREISFPTSFKPYVRREDGEEAYFSSSLSLQGFYASQHRTVTMLYLHRSFFAQAMLDYPSNPLLSPFAPSFLTAYRCASIIIKASAHQFDRCAEMAMRVWFLMYHTFSAAIIVGTVVTRSPNSSVASSALDDLNRAVELFERTAVQSQRARVALGVLHKLKEKAVRAYTQYISTNQAVQPSTSPQNLLAFCAEQQAIDDEDDELAIFGGQTRVLARKSRCRRSATSGGSADSASPPVDGSESTTPSRGPSEWSSSAALSTMSVTAAEVQPTLVEYLGPASFRTSQEVPTPPPAPVPVLEGSSRMSSHAQSGQDVALLPQPSTASGDGFTTGQSGDGYTAPSPEKQLTDFLLGSVADAPMSNAAAGPSKLDSYSYPSASYPLATPLTRNAAWDQQKWPDLSIDMDGLPNPDTSFGWLPPPRSRVHFGEHQQTTPNSLWSSMPAKSANSSARDTQWSMQHDQYILPPYSYSDGQLRYAGAEPSNVSSGFESSAMDMDPAGALIEVGLMTGSDIDSGWFSFMQDCGIMGTASTSTAGT